MMKPFRSGTALVVLLGTLASACPGGDRGPPFELERLRWEDTILTTGHAHVMFHLRDAGTGDLHLDIEMEGFPAGTALDVAGTSGRADETGALALRVDPGLKVGAFDIDTLGEARDLDVPITLTVPGAPPVEERLPPILLRHIAGDALLRVREGPVRFDGEPEQPAGQAGLAVVTTGPQRSFRLIGSAQKLWDVDFVAIADTRDSGRTEHCKGYQRQGSDEAIWIVVSQHDTTIHIYERRTGKKRVEKTFQPAKTCPERAYARGRIAHTTVAMATYRPWLESELARLGQP